MNPQHPQLIGSPTRRPSTMFTFPSLLLALVWASLYCLCLIQPSLAQQPFPNAISMSNDINRDLILPEP